jgi:hypothetical protein
MGDSGTLTDASTWRELVYRQGQSGLTVAAFCEREALSVASFYGWRSKLRQKPDVDSRPVAVTEKSGAAEMSTGGFIDLGALGMRGPRIEVRLELGGAVALQLVRG